MKHYFEKINCMQVVSMIMFVLAVVSGGAAMAVTIGEEGPTVNTKDSGTNPVKEIADETTQNRPAPGGKMEGQDLTGTQASATQIRKGGMAEDEWDNELVQFEPYNTPFLSMTRRAAKTYQTQGYERKHMRNGGDTLEAKVHTAINADTESSGTVTHHWTDTITLSSLNVNGNLRPFYKGTKIYCLGVPGYKKGSQTDKQGTLTLIVTGTSNNFGTITCAALNGPATTSGEQYVTDELDCRQVPEIPAGTILSAGAVSMSESQLLVTPENYRPTEHTVYLQKKGFNIIFTDEYEKIKKKQPLSVANIKADTIRKYNLRAERDYFLGVKARWNTTNEDGSTEYAYSSEGIIPQLPMSMCLDVPFKFPVFGALNMAQFTEFSAHNVAYAFCGKSIMQQLNTVNMPEGYQHSVESVKEFDIDFKKYKDTFGTMYYTWDQTLDMLHMEDCMVIVDLQGLVRYVHLAEKERTNDMSKGAGEIRDAKRLIKTEADALALRGYNGIFVGPTQKVLGFNPKDVKQKIQIAATMPTSSLSDGMLVALTADDATNGYKAGVVYKYNSAATSWEVFNATMIA